MFLNKVVILPVFIFAFFAIASLVEGNLFYFFLWLFASLFFFVSIYPFTTEMKDTNAPVFHIVASLIIFPIFFSLLAFFDFKQAGFPISQSTLYGLAIGVLLTAFIMLIKGK